MFIYRERERQRQREKERERFRLDRERRRGASKFNSDTVGHYGNIEKYQCF